MDEVQVTLLPSRTQVPAEEVTLRELLALLPFITILAMVVPAGAMTVIVEPV